MFKGVPKSVIVFYSLGSVFLLFTAVIAITDRHNIGAIIRSFIPCVVFFGIGLVKLLLREHGAELESSEQAAPEYAATSQSATAESAVYRSADQIPYARPVAPPPAAVYNAPAPAAGAAYGNPVQPTVSYHATQPQAYSAAHVRFCPRCGSSDLDVQVFQENTSSTAVTTTKSVYKRAGHGFFWWLFIGWWWWIIDLFLWIFYFFPRLLIHLIFGRKKYKGKSVSVTKATNNIRYKSVFVCKSCGNHWSS